MTVKNAETGAVSARRWSRRRALVALSALPTTARIPFLRFAPAGWLPIAPLLASTAPLPDKPGLRVLNDRPLNVETPAHLLDDDVTPADRLFVRNNGVPPPQADRAAWRLRVDGEACVAPATFSIAELQARFETVALRLVLECAGNGRAEFRPRVPGNQWTTGAVGCPEWRGVRLRDLLTACGVADDAVYVAYEGADTHLSGDPGKRPISRGVPLHKAMEAESLVAFAMNGAPIPAIHGAPLRLVVGGWPGSVCGKWLTRLMIRDRVHDGAKMLGASYRIPVTPVAPGATVADGDMQIIESMPVKSLITAPQSGGRIARAKSFEVRGHAWAGDRAVRSVAVSVDFGATWQQAQLADPHNRMAWQRWRTTLQLDRPGYYEIWARATDDSGASQPMLVPGWNPKGYLNNAAHRIALDVA